MAEVLSQSQIDALLNSLKEGSGDAAESPKTDDKKDKYRKYDFYSPKKFTKDRLNLLNSIYENYSRIVASQVNSLFRLTSEWSVFGVEEQRYYEFSNALGENDVICVLDVTVPDSSKAPPVVLNIGKGLMVQLIDHMLGGSGDVGPVDSSYVYTDIEMALYRKIIDYITRAMKDSWLNYITLDFDIQRVEENPGMFQEIGIDETTVIIVLEVRIGKEVERLSICFPGNLLTAIFVQIDKKKHVARGADYDNSDRRAEIMKNVCESDLEVVAELGRAEIGLADVYNLQVGDVINLNKPEDSEVKVYVSGQPWFDGRMGVSNRKLAVQLSNWLKPELMRQKEPEPEDEELKSS